MDRTKDRDVVLGKTLAETALSNSPEYIAGAEASAAVQRVARRAEPTAQSRRHFRVVVLMIIIVLALTLAVAYRRPLALPFGTDQLRPPARPPSRTRDACRIDNTARKADDRPHIPDSTDEKYP